MKDMIVGKIIKKINKHNRDNKVFKKWYAVVSSYLKNGKYFFNKSKKLLILDNLKKTQHGISGYLLDHDYCFRPISIKHSSGNFSLLLICNNDKSVKLFDFDNLIVRTFYDSDNSLNEYLSNRQKNPSFPTSNIIGINKDDLFIDEEMLINKKTENKFLKLLDFYSVYYLKNNTFRDSMLEQLINNQNVRSSFLEHFNVLFKRNGFDFSKFPWQIQHGDVWSSNVFFDENGIRFIDFDRVGSYPLFYDVILYAYTEGFLNRNLKLCNYIIKGEYDDYFSKILGRRISGRICFALCIEVMLLIRHETKGDYRVTDEVLDFLTRLGVFL